ncbi:Transcription elongation factor GreA [hydrothermal vent metagenome]|uniref:Transcription elongation factor GreA n=1 Tax=hydrothermal vent metagenome TaxID=652676 RepID=A0A3B1CKS5_9ZZZZ
MYIKIIRKLEDEMNTLDHELRVDLPRELKTAADHGDLSENAEYDAAKERKRFVESRISVLQKRVSEIKSIDINRIPHDRVGLGSFVKLEDLDTDEVVEYTFVLPEESNPDKGKISLATPIGKALVGKKVGDDIEVITPKGKREFEIVELTTVHDQSKKNA